MSLNIYGKNLEDMTLDEIENSIRRLVEEKQLVRKEVIELQERNKTLSVNLKLYKDKDDLFETLIEENNFLREVNLNLQREKYGVKKWI